MPSRFTKVASFYWNFMLLFARFAITFAEKNKNYLKTRLDTTKHQICFSCFFPPKNLGKSEYIAEWVFCFF